MPGSIYTRRLSFFGRKSVLELFIGKAGAFHDFSSYVFPYLIIVLHILENEVDYR
jgi:hypothetical protein